MSTQEIPQSDKDWRLFRYPFIETPEGILYMSLLKNSTKIFLHVAYRGDSITVKKYKNMLLDFERIKDYFKQRGVNSLYSFVEADEKPLKFNSMFGLEPVQQLNTQEGEPKLFICRVDF